MRAKLALALTLVVLWPAASRAQSSAIRSDGTLRVPTAVTNGGDAYTIGGGTPSGTNLFHSFDKFSVPTFGSATFVGDPATTNIINRVTGYLSGREASLIDGTIDTRSMPSANFFLINPSGVMFGPNASLQVGGSFHVSTADKIIFGDGEFSATPGSGDAVLSSLPPQAFGFLSSNPAAITLDGPLLVGDPAQTISFVGGDITINPRTIVWAPGGRVQIVSAASSGSVDIATADTKLSRLGNVTISGGDPDLPTVVTAGGADFGIPGGSVVIRSGRLVIEGINTLVLSDTGDLAGAATGLDLRASDSMVVRNGALLQTSSFGVADASGISITSTDVTMSGGAMIQSVGFQDGKSGNINIHANRLDVLDSAIRTQGNVAAVGDITVAASGRLTVAGPTSEIGTKAFNTSLPGVFAGNISLTAADVVLRDGGKIQSGDTGAQAGQTVSVTANNTLSISGLAGISSQAFSQTAGAVNISAGQLVIDAGYINSSTLGAGGAGRISVRADGVSLTNGAQIASSSEISAFGAGGSIAINAGSVNLSGVGPANGVGTIIFTGSPNSGLFTTTAGSGNAGQINVVSSTLTIGGGGKISASTTGSGNAGTIVTNVGALSMAGGGTIESSTSSGGSGGSINVQSGSLSMAGAGTALSSIATASGNAGQIALSGRSVTVNDGARISVTTSGAGNAGTITSNVGSMTVNGGHIDSSTSAAGAGGAINVTAASQVSVLNGGQISADSTGSGLTGNITIAAGNRITMTGGSISTRALTSDGGNITLKAPQLVRLENSQIVTSVQSGVGAGGNITIDPQFLIVNNSTISANAFGGSGGNITIVADNFLPSSTALFEASSALSTPGTIQIVSPENNIAGSIAQLPRAFVDASRLMRGACSARREGAPSSFTLAGRGGVPPDADGYLPSVIIGGANPAPLAFARVDDCAR